MPTFAPVFQMKPHMKLAIDVGNTLVKTAVFNQDEMLSFNRHKDLNADSIETLFQQHNTIKSVIVGSVRDLPDDFAHLFPTHVQLNILNHHTTLPIVVSYQSPSTLGVDRIAAVVAANHMYPGKNLLVIETGTCITYDFIDDSAVYHGGSISPGLGLRFSALHNFTDKLPLVEPVRDVALVGTTTETSIQSGVINGLIAEIQGIISMYESNYENLTIILSGGNLEYFDKNLKNNIFAVPNIVLRGLNIIQDFNDKN
jgi:type III pantothenate kinase